MTEAEWLSCTDALAKFVQHCHNCKLHVSGKSILHPSGVCENC